MLFVHTELVVEVVSDVVYRYNVVVVIFIGVWLYAGMDAQVGDLNWVEDTSLVFFCHCSMFFLILPCFLSYPYYVAISSSDSDYRHRYRGNGLDYAWFGGVIQFTYL